MEAILAFIITRTVRPGSVRGYGAKPYQGFSWVGFHPMDGLPRLSDGGTG